MQMSMCWICPKCESVHIMAEHKCDCGFEFRKRKKPNPNGNMFDPRWLHYKGDSKNETEQP